MDTFFQKPQSEWTDFEKRAFEEVQNICNRHDGDAEARYGAWEAMIWLSSQSEVQSKWKPSEEQMEHLKRCFSHGMPHLPMPNQHVLESLYNDLKQLM